MTLLTFAHRGGLDGGFAPNSLAAFADARARGCEIETDLRLSADGQVVCAHDAFWFAGVHPVWVARESARRLARRDVPTLQRLYEELGTDFEVSVDLKVLAAAGPAMALAGRHGALRRLWLVSADLDALIAIRTENVEVRLMHEARHRDLDAAGVTPDEHLGRLARERIDSVNTTVGHWTPELVARARELGVRAFGSLLQTRRSMERAVELGLDGFYSDHLDLMRAVATASPGSAEPPG